ncbi:MAG TPA: cupin domain-containing protein [Myxococcaceae bacterium]|nr:cupin domain-containing protein [Myxococcaceae bacterium]
MLPRDTWRTSSVRLSSTRSWPVRTRAVQEEREATMTTRRVEKPWGYELIWAHTERYVGKLLHVKQGHKLSLQYHNKKDETIHVQSGKLLFVVDEGQGLIEKEMNPGESYHIKPLTKHRMVAITDCDILEVSTPELDDVVRLEDAYGRQGTSKA